MSMITEKRDEIASKLASLLAERTKTIDDKVKAYRLSLESEPLSEEIINTRKLLVAIDDVISCEALLAKSETAEKIAEQKPEIVEAVKCVAEATPEVSTTIVETDITAVEEIEVIPETENIVELREEAAIADCVEVLVNTETNTAEVKGPVETARPGMAYVGIPERR